MTTDRSAVPPLFSGLCDDAAIFPPGDLPLPQAVPAHLVHRAAWYAELVGPFLCGAGGLETLVALAPEELRIGVIVPGGSTALEPALRTAATGPGLRVAGVEVAADSGVEPAEGVRRVLAAFDRLLPDGAVGAVEVPRGPGVAAALDALAGTPHRAKFRTGGTVAAAFPDEEELAAFLLACAERGLPFKCTAGLHNALRHTDPDTGFEHHGFLNVLLATHAAAEGGGPREVAELLAERSGPALAALAEKLTSNQIATVRGSFTAFGTCSVLEPLEDLIALGLISAP
ncbi:hypothetical protein P3T36_000876 [Kitasatospora sp. MAP12-15]|uniref:hypothetical protein n=1 Tax=unclassified Kitasatospora TaxID=2633591 RepID=UPI002475E8FF|nr:hypothetical protein [Kitasatospora sp. MAP12-44]MDH6114476.1 hypothetical protein [Kitasatospora sp. MAP12-44]